MVRTIISNATVVLPAPGGLEAGCTVILEDGRIAEVRSAGQADRPLPPADEEVDAQGGILAPGLIDVHVHATHEFRIDAGPEDLAELCRVFPRYGVTGFLATVTPLPKGEDARFVASLAQVQSQGAGILGFHLEGPFLALTGALPPEALGGDDADRAGALIDATGDCPAIFSIAPEFEGIGNLIPIMAAGGTPVFMTHTAANVEQTQAAIEAGVRHATHFYDVFPCPPETDPGVRPCGAVEAVLADPRVTVDVILDGEHVNPAAVGMMLQCKGPAGVSLITDANIGAGLPPGRYRFGDQEVEFAYFGGPARMTANARYPGGLSGSGLTMDRAVRNAVELLGVDAAQAIRMGSANPAAVLGLAGRKGQVAEGFDADLVLFSESLTVRRTWVAGRCVYKESPNERV